jgi:hypothetical protein
LQAFRYVAGEIVAEVEVRGRSIVKDDKECWSEMRIVRAWKWTKKDSVSLAILVAEKVLPIYEKKYPKDDRPRKAIEAARKVLESNTEKNRKAAAEAAGAAEAAEAAGAAEAAEAVWAAVWATVWAARAAWEAARAAAWATVRAVVAAVAAWVQKKDFTALLDKWFLERITTLKEIK